MHGPTVVWLSNDQLTVRLIDHNSNMVNSIVWVVFSKLIHLFPPNNRGQTLVINGFLMPYIYSVKIDR
jgi:hypothetical protein